MHPSAKFENQSLAKLTTNFDERIDKPTGPNKPYDQQLAESSGQLHSHIHGRKPADWDAQRAGIP